MIPPGYYAARRPARLTSWSPLLLRSVTRVAGTDIAQSPGLWRADFEWTDSPFPQAGGSLVFAVLPQRPPVKAPPSFGSMADLASGGGWETTIQLVNTSGASGQANIGFFGDDGRPIDLPIVSGTSTSAIVDTLAPNAALLIDSPTTGALQTGYAQLTTDAGVGGFMRFRYAPTDQEVIVPLETRKAGSYVLAFDNTSGIATDVAVTNLTPLPASIPVLIRDNTGAQVGSASVALPANGHSSFVLSDQFASTANQTGTAEFDAPVGGQISVLGLRVPPSGRFTTIPVLASTDPGGGLMPDLAVGDGWTTTIELVNNSANFADAHLSFFNDGGPPLSLPWTLSGASTTASVLNQTMAPHARIVIESNAAGGDPLQTGSTQLTTNGSVSGFARFRYGDREAIVPIEGRKASSYVLAFDNTNGATVGVAISSAVSAQPNIPAVIRDSTGARIGLGIVALAANGHSAFVLSDQFPMTANQSGTIEFGTPADGQISVLGVRIQPSGAFSMIPVLTP
jgi:hypothetical protein